MTTDVSAIPRDLLSILICPRCLSPLCEREPSYAECAKCMARVPVHDGIPHFSTPPSDVIPDYNANYVHDRTRWSAWRRKNYDFFRRAMQIVPHGSTVVDLGAGPNFFADLFVGHCHYAVDFYRYPGIHVVTDFVQQNVPIRSEVADVVVLSNVLEHLSRPDRLLRESHRLLKVGGSILVTVPFLFKIHQAPYDFYRYTHFKLREMLSDAGFQVLTIDKLGSMLDLLGSIQYELLRIAERRSRHAWLLRQCFRFGSYIDRLIQKLGHLDDQTATDQDYFVGYSCIGRKS